MEFLIKPFLNPAVKQHIKDKGLKLDKANTFFVSLFGIVGFLVTPIVLTLTNTWSWGPWIAAFVLYWVSGIGITMGYHRYFSHRTFDAKRWVEVAMVLAGSMALQNSVLKWSSDHRIHHGFVDTDKDPYNAKLGFLWSHILWIFYADDKEQGGAHFSGDDSAESLMEQFPNCRDLIKDPLIRFQHAYALPLGAFLCFAIPAAIALMTGGSVLAYVLVAGFTRLAFVHHCTYFINSICHIWGDQPHSEKHTAVDNPWFAFVSYGEGFHNYHHTYPNDYRNGIKAYHFDPTKWAIRSLSYFGQTYNLRRAKIRPKQSRGAEPTVPSVGDVAEA